MVITECNVSAMINGKWYLDLAQPTNNFRLLKKIENHIHPHPQKKENPRISRTCKYFFGLTTIIQ